MSHNSDRVLSIRSGIPFRVITRTCRRSGQMDRGGPVGKASGRTLIAKSTHAPDPCKSSLFVTSSHSPQMSIDRLLRPWRAVYPCPLLHLTGLLSYQSGAVTPLSPTETDNIPNRLPIPPNGGRLMRWRVVRYLCYPKQDTLDRISFSYDDNRQ